MGCNDSRKGLTQEEIALQDKEALLFLHSKYCDDLLFVFTFHAHSGLLSPNGFKEALSKLGLPAATEDFMRVMDGIRQDGGYDLQRLQLICILLSAPRVNSKPAALFTLYDTRDQLSLPKSRIEGICQDLLTASIVDLGRLETSARALDYLEGLSKLKREFTQVMVSKVVGDNEVLSKEEFVTAWAGIETAKYLTAGGLRAALAEYKKTSSIGRFPKQVASISSLAQT